MNYHLHTNYSGDTKFSAKEMALAAKNLEFTEICFTDHLILDKTLDKFGCGMDVKKLNKRKKEIQNLKIDGLKIKCGIEIDWLPNKLAQTKKLIANNDFDCILGAAHSVKRQQTVVYSDERRKAFWGMMNDDEIYKQHIDYYTAIQEMAKNKICDVIAHLDLIKRDAYLPKKSLKKVLIETVKVIADNDLSIEINTGGLRNPIKEIHPSLAILKMCKKHNIAVTIGTDAHWTNQLNEGYDAGMALIKKAKYKQLAVFDKRKRSLIDID
ncbi:MAG: histidinol-phosphatase [Candidatus Aenigmatarchaeota archaeon]